MDNLFWIGFVGAALALIFAYLQKCKVMKCSEGDEKMVKIALTTLSILSIMICLLCNFSFSRRQSGRARDSIQKICQKCNHVSAM